MTRFACAVNLGRPRAAAAAARACPRAQPATMNFNTGSVLANISRLGQTAAKAAASRVADGVTAATQGKVEQAYELGPHVATAGPAGMWRIHRARPKRAIQSAYDAACVRALPPRGNWKGGAARAEAR